MRRTLPWLPVVIWAAVILSASNDSFSSNASRGWLATLFGREMPYALNFAMRKAGHILAYGLLGALAWRAGKRIGLSLTVVLLVAATDEYKQALTHTRTGTIWDVVLDLCAALLVLLAIRRGAAGRTPSS